MKVYDVEELVTTKRKSVNIDDLCSLITEVNNNYPYCAFSNPDFKRGWDFALEKLRAELVHETEDNE